VVVDWNVFCEELANDQSVDALIESGIASESWSEQYLPE